MSKVLVMIKTLALSQCPNKSIFQHFISVSPDFSKKYHFHYSLCAINRNVILFLYFQFRLQLLQQSKASQCNFADGYFFYKPRSSVNCDLIYNWHFSVDFLSFLCFNFRNTLRFSNSSKFFTNGYYLPQHSIGLTHSDAGFRNWSIATATQYSRRRIVGFVGFCQFFFVLV
jgi:hypothetical protein